MDEELSTMTRTSTLSMAGCGTTVSKESFVVGSPDATSRVRHAAVERAANARREVNVMRRDMHDEWPRVETPVRSVATDARCASTVFRNLTFEPLPRLL